MADTDLSISPDEKVAGVPLARLLRNLDETSYNEGSVDLSCRLTDCKAVIEELLQQRALASRPAEVDDTTWTLNNPPYGQPDLYSRLHTALANESMLAKKFGKLREWFSAVRGLIDWMEHESKSAPSHTTNKEK